MIIHHTYITFHMQLTAWYWICRAEWGQDCGVDKLFLSSLNASLQASPSCELLTSTPHEGFPLYIPLQDQLALTQTGSAWINWTKLVVHSHPLTILLPWQSVMHSCKIETGWKQNKGRFYSKKTLGLEWRSWEKRMKRGTCSPWLWGEPTAWA